MQFGSFVVMLCIDNENFKGWSETFEYPLYMQLTYNTNRTRHELYSVMAIIDGTEFPIPYLLLAAGKN